MPAVPRRSTFGTLAMIRHHCPMCHAELHSSPHLAGMTIRCQACGEPVLVAPDPGPALYKRPLVLGCAGVLLFAVACAALAVVLGKWTALALGMVLLAVAVVGGIACRMYERSPRDGTRLRVPDVVGVPVLAVFVAAVAVLACAFVLPGTARVHVDNASRHDVVLEVDGEAWATVPRGATPVLSLPQGDHVIVVRDAASGAELDRVPVAGVRAGWKYLFNVLGAQTYRRGEVTYVPVGAVGPPASSQPAPAPEQELRDKWMDVSTVDFLFQEPPERREGYTGKHTYLQRRQ